MCSRSLRRSPATSGFRTAPRTWCSPVGFGPTAAPAPTSAGVPATVADLRELGSRLLSFYGQHEHRKLMLTTAQLDALDAFCGPEQSRLRVAAAAAHERVRGLEVRLAELDGLAGARDRELDLVAFELREIEEIDPSEEECEPDRPSATGSAIRRRCAWQPPPGCRRWPPRTAKELPPCSPRPPPSSSPPQRSIARRSARWPSALGAALRRRGPRRGAALVPGRNRGRRAGATARVRRGAPGGVYQAVSQARRRDRGGAGACRALPSS